MAVAKGKAAEKRGRGRPPTPGKEQLSIPEHELFCLTYIKNGFKRTPAYQHAYGTEKSRNANKLATRLLKRPDIQNRLRYLLREQGKSRVTLDAIQKDAIDGRMWAVIERCMQHEKVETPVHMRARSFKPCAACKKKEDQPSKWCASCKSNQKLIEDWEAFGGVYKFDPRGAVQALLPLGRDRGLYIDKKLVGHMEGDEIIDAMNDEEIRNLIRSLATEVGLRVVEARSESSDGSPTEQGPHLRSVS
jgi:hypothetical protein